MSTNGRTRCLLHKTQLAEYKSFCKEWGWMEEPTKGEFEVLRMRHPQREKLLLVHTKLNAAEHLTVHGESARLCEDFFGFGRGRA